ncbi:MAG: hypothetical protein IPO60_14865 [Flavobacteriales bacterium]|jgi:hypothetical protein|nr:hypothetical protein [Flavobacteriales bacterium]MBK7247185.1 hypothetical protein [Flavobacteriales bacterium]MBK7288675.1 hypothetical protein [Flavobacteriales bacterium]MBK9599545.1 hypothetical protein [Flavobacteriales bacterium]QQS71665.1 MAG: hypothetical protein IPP95_10765 [Flavobacteriales bacterium]
MTTLELRAEIKQLLSREKNTSVLEAIRMLLRREDAETDDDFTDEELAELEQRRARYVSGESKPHTVEESMRLAREGFKR